MFRRMYSPVIALFCLLIGVGAGQTAQAQNGEPGGSAPDSMSMTADTTAPVDPAVALNTAYATIQTQFQTVKPLFEKGCFDCHSANTHYPWYHSLPLIKSLIDSDIRGARKHVDFTDGFPFKGHARPADDLLDIRGELVDGDMPPWNYRLMHWNAKPSPAELDTMVTWIDSSLRLLAAHGQYPFDRRDLVPPEGQPTNKPIGDGGGE